MQTNPALYRGFLPTATSILRSEGVLVLWSGALPAFASAAIENGVVFTANGIFRRALAGGAAEDALTLPQHALIGGLSGVISATAICPAEVVKCQLQVGARAGAQAASVGPLAVLSQILRTSGPAGLYTGYPALLLRDVPFNTLFFGSYRAYCAAFVAARERAGWGRHGGGMGRPTQHHLSPAEYFLSGGFAGMTAWAAVFPFDAVKSRMQSGAAVGSFAQVARAMWKAGGIRVFYKGCSAALLRAFPANAALFSGVEFASKVLKGA